MYPSAPLKLTHSKIKYSVNSKKGLCTRRSKQRLNIGLAFEKFGAILDQPKGHFVFVVLSMVRNIELNTCLVTNQKRAEIVKSPPSIHFLYPLNPI